MEEQYPTKIDDEAKPVFSTLDWVEIDKVVVYFMLVHLFQLWSYKIYINYGKLVGAYL